MGHLATPAMLRCVSPGDVDTRDTSTIPGRGDLRISLTTKCNLACSHCHNEGQTAPWLSEGRNAADSLDGVERLLAMGARYGAKSVKFTGGDPTSFPQFAPLLARVSSWRRSFPKVKNWGISTNGVAFMNPRLFDQLATSELDNICIGIDSVSEEELSKPSSSSGVKGRHLLDRFVAPLAARWPDRKIKLNVVFTGNVERVLGVIDAALSLDVDVSVIEVNGVMDVQRDVREAFFALMNYVAGRYQLSPGLYEPLNEIYLYDSGGDARIKFYQDHCVDRDCGACRNIHLRVSPQPEGWSSVPCFLLAQSSTLSLMEGKELSALRFEEAIRRNGMGPTWRADGASQRSAETASAAASAAGQAPGSERELS